MVTTFFGERNRLIHPRQVFREGFRIAATMCPAMSWAPLCSRGIADSIAAAGGVSVRARMPGLFGGDVAGMDQRKRQMRRQFVVRILTPLAVAALNACEKIGETDDFEISAAEVLGTREGEDGSQELAMPASLLAYLEEPAAGSGAGGWRLADFSFRARRAEVDACVRNVLQTALRDMGEAIDHLGVDAVLLTGRPSRLPAVRAMVREMMLVPPDRLVSMHRYRAGAWYPFRDPVTNEVGDPKTTVATGAMLFALCDSRIANFRLTAEALQMRSTARFVGVMANDGQIVDRDILFAEADEPAASVRQAGTKPRCWWTTRSISASGNSRTSAGRRRRSTSSTLRMRACSGAAAAEGHPAAARQQRRRSGESRASAPDRSSEGGIRRRLRGGQGATPLPPG